MITDAIKTRWNERYQQPEYAYGELPNAFLKAQLERLQPGRILLPAEGEGRNAVFAASLGWTVSAFDISAEGQKKAFLLAEKKGVHIDYQVGDLQTIGYEPESFDVIALIFAHFQPEIKSLYHKTLSTYLRKGGLVILEAFSKKNLEYVAKNEKVGGPKDIDTLLSTEEIRRDFDGFEILELQETEITLQEGLYHNGTGSVLRFLGRK